MNDVPDRLNQAAWRDRRTVDIFARRAGFFRPAEALVVERLALSVRNGPVLDIGIGGGRTAEFLAPITNDYVGIDYLPELVEAARRRFPGLRFEQIDARNMSDIPSGRFAGAVFSLNGIDGMSHSDRGAALGEISRVLRPGGCFAYSTHNLAFAHVGIHWRPDPRRTLRHPGRSISFLADNIHERWSRLHLREIGESGEGWAMIVTRAYGHPVVWHHTTCAEIGRELTQAGFADDPEVYTVDGADALSDDMGDVHVHSPSPDFHILAHKPT